MHSLHLGRPARLFPSFSPVTDRSVNIGRLRPNTPFQGLQNAGKAQNRPWRSFLPSTDQETPQFRPIWPPAKSDAVSCYVSDSYACKSAPRSPTAHAQPSCPFFPLFRPSPTPPAPHPTPTRPALQTNTSSSPFRLPCCVHPIRPSPMARTAAIAAGASACRASPPPSGRTAALGPGSLANPPGRSRQDRDSRG